MEKEDYKYKSWLNKTIYLLCVCTIAYSQDNRIIGKIIVNVDSDYPYYFIVSDQSPIDRVAKSDEGFAKDFESKEDAILAEEIARNIKAREKLSDLLNKKIMSPWNLNDSISTDPNCRFALFCKKAEHVVIINLDYGDTTMIDFEYGYHYDYHFSWSHDGNYLAIAVSDRHTDGYYVIDVIDLHKKNFKKIELDKHINALTWSPDSKYLAVVTQTVVDNPFNFLLKYFGHGIISYNFYLNIIKCDNNIKEELLLAEKFKYGNYSKVYWEK
jgi:WD40 repeat protein